ncbi:MAG: hypothetical protein LH468_05270 [Nocardioides sp.]|nr:hypothetical protein [Nocardioides sp.]
MSGHEQDPLPDPTGEARSGDMGVSSERVGPTGPGQVGSDGVRDVGPPATPVLDAPPEQSRGGVEVNPDPPIPPVAGYPSHHPDAEDHPFDTGP